MGKTKVQKGENGEYNPCFQYHSLTFCSNCMKKIQKSNKQKRYNSCLNLLFLIRGNGGKAIFSGVTVDLNIQGKFSISHIQLLVSRRLMWCDEANTVIQKTLGDGMDFYMYGAWTKGWKGLMTQQTFVSRLFFHDIPRRLEISRNCPFSRTIGQC